MADDARVTLAWYQVILAGPANWMKEDPLIINAAHVPRVLATRKSGRSLLLFRKCARRETQAIIRWLADDLLWSGVSMEIRVTWTWELGDYIGIREILILILFVCRGMKVDNYKSGEELILSYHSGSLNNYIQNLLDWNFVIEVYSDSNILRSV